jgi:hypothetical protein
MSDFATLQQDVIDRTLREAAAHGEAGMAGPDDDRGDCGGCADRRDPLDGAQRQVSSPPP